MLVKMRHCALAEKEHREKLRWYAHTYHYENTICVCNAFWDLPKDNREAIILHEIGHLAAGPSGNEQDANNAAEALFGTKIRYADSPYGRKLETLKRSNPMEQGKWIPVHAVRFNKDGSVSLLGEHAASTDNPAKLSRFQKLERQLEAKGAYSPGGLARYIGVKKYGAKGFARLQAKGRKRR